ncbi:MAG: amidohydrolase [Acidimicrobiaceae bacterium]|nr:amidohydrolase [Acidimicrobiaceae bacterium]MBO0713956.1 amidohydrolase [Acidimicrobiales bacterium]
MDLEALVGIDVHVHAGRSSKAPAADAPSEGGGTLGEMIRGSGAAGQTLDETAAWYRERRIACCIWGADPYASAGFGPNAVSNDEMLENASRNNDVFIPFVMVDPWGGRRSVREAERLIADGARGFKFHPPAQAFEPNNRKLYPIYEVIEGSGVPALFHTGQTAVGQGARAGGGIYLKYGNPMFLDDLCVDFPDMPIIMAHPSFPWQDEALSIAVCKPTAYIDLSGWLPRYFPPMLVQYANTLLRNKVLFGSDHPMITTDRWLSDFHDGEKFRDEVKPLILKENAAKLLKLAA